MSGGAVLYINGLFINAYHVANSNISGSVNLVCADRRGGSSTDIHDELQHIPVEFAGAITSVMSYVCV